MSFDDDDEGLVILNRLSGHELCVHIARSNLMDNIELWILASCLFNVRVFIGPRKSSPFTFVRVYRPIDMMKREPTSELYKNPRGNGTFRSMNPNKQQTREKSYPWTFPCRPRACHGNYPTACHTKLSLILRLGKKNPSAFLPIHRSSVCVYMLAMNSGCSPAVFSIGFPWPLLCLHSKPFCVSIRRRSFTW